MSQGHCHLRDAPPAAVRKIAAAGHPDIVADRVLRVIPWHLAGRPGVVEGVGGKEPCEARPKTLLRTTGSYPKRV